MIRIRTVLIMATIAIGVTARGGADRRHQPAQGADEEERQHTKAVSAMVKGEAPFDAKVVTAAFTQWSDTAAQLPKAVPGQFEERRRDPRAAEDLGATVRASMRQVAAFAKAVGGPAERTLEGLKKAFPAVGKACGDCHEGYRAAAKK